jgi:hypothetical protein
VKPSRRLGWIAVVGGLAAQSLAYLLAITVQPDLPVISWFTILGLAGTLSGTLFLGVANRAALSGPMVFAVVALFFIPVLGFGAALLLPAESLADPLILGLPRRAAVVLLGVGLMPVLIFPALYARDGADNALTPERMEEIRRECETAMAAEE